MNNHIKKGTELAERYHNDNSFANEVVGYITSIYLCYKMLEIAAEMIFSTTGSFLVRGNTRKKLVSLEKACDGFNNAMVHDKILKIDMNLIEFMSYNARDILKLIRIVTHTTRNNLLKIIENAEELCKTES